MSTGQDTVKTRSARQTEVARKLPESDLVSRAATLNAHGLRSERKGLINQRFGLLLFQGSADKGLR